MLKEIGSEFWYIETQDDKDQYIPDGAKWFISGRAALRAIIQDIKKNCDVKTAALPSWCCDSMIIPFKLEGINVKFYPVHVENGKLKQTLCNDCDITLVMDYFGFNSDVEANQNSGIIVRDLTHNPFMNQHKDADYYFGSIRKWTGAYNGGFAWKLKPWEILPQCDIKNKYTDLRKAAMKNKQSYMISRCSNKAYLRLFADAEQMLDSCEILCADSKDVDRCLKIDVNSIVSIRQRNARTLINGLKNHVLFNEVDELDCPMFVPILANNRDELRRYLTDNQVYCPMHWPLSEHHSLDDRTKIVYEKSLSLVCDQRYGEEEMNQIIQLVKQVIR